MEPPVASTLKMSAYSYNLERWNIYRSVWSWCVSGWVQITEWSVVVGSEERWEMKDLEIEKKRRREKSA
jgi:hypothetical protein